MKGIQQTRIQLLNDKPAVQGDFVLYWMQQSQRAEYNHALEYAISRANDLQQPLLVVFGLTDEYPEANLRHYAFMLEGLQETQAALEKRGIKMVVRRGRPHEVALKVGRKASLIVCDRGYLPHQKEWRERTAEAAECCVVLVESDVIVPVEVVSSKAEYAARTIRPKLHRHLADHLVKPPRLKVSRPALDLNIQGIDLTDIHTVLKRLKIDRTVSPAGQFFQGGTTRAKRRWQSFIRYKLHRYVQNRNQPQTDDVSHMSMYLHFGQISSLYLALAINRKAQEAPEAVDAYMEELVVRRELAMNYAHYTPAPDAFGHLPAWARKTLEEHSGDHRPHVYSRQQLENAETHDPYWNAAMKEMALTGFMHNYMRMYWGKKILEWTKDPVQAFETALAINNKFFIDGRDPNSYAGVGWVFGLHDRAWPQRPIYGKVRTMTASGLERKCDIRAYVDKINALIK